MSPRRLLLPLLVLPLLLFLRIATAAGPSANQHPIDSANYTDPQQYAYLAPLLNGVEVVSLAESIHMTHEFPLIRFGMLRYIHEHLGFDVLAFEGSPVDLWVTQDQFLSSSESPETAASQADSGLVAVWNTSEIKQIFAYEQGSWKTSHPLYITAYDVQPGSGRGTRGADAFQLLAQHLRMYAPAPAGFDQGKWLQSLTRVSSSCSQYAPADEPDVASAIDTAEKWIAAAAPEVAKKYSGLPHAAALRLVPESLRASLALCQAIGSGKGDWANYKTTRDKLAAQFALSLKSAAPGGKLMLWAHISHLFYDDEKSSTSVGEILHAALQSRLYSIAGFALSGGAVMLFNDTTDDIGYAFVGRDAGTIEKKLTAPCQPACFLDMRTAPEQWMLEPQPVWFEAQLSRMSLAKDFDGVFFVSRVHAPDLPLIMFLVFSTLHYQWELALAVAAITGGVAWLIARRIIRRRRRVAVS